jgi:hypothetical protein
VIVIGIDLGLTGAACAIDEGGARVEDLPTRPDGTGARLDGRALILLLRAFMPADRHAIAVCEDIRPRPMGNGGAHGNTMHSQGSLMRSRGALEAACDIAGIRIVWVQPQAWRRFYGLLGASAKNKGDAKKAALEHARKLYPGTADRLARVKDQNRAESILIGHYARAKELGQ